MATKLLTSPTGKRQVADDYSLFMTSWINLNIHDWFFHSFSNTDFYTAKWGPGKKDTFKLRKTIFDDEGFAANTETPWSASTAALLFLLSDDPSLLEGPS